METTKLERRYIPLEVRAQGEGAAKIGGIAAVVDVVTDMGYYEEKIERGAFDSVLNNDVRCLYNHEDCQVLGRTKSGTLRLSIDAAGNLEYECDMDMESPIHQTAYRAIQRGDVNQSSYQYRAKTVEWTSSAKYGDMGLRVIKEIDLLADVSPVTFPAYEATEVEARSIVEARDSEKMEMEKATQAENEEREAHLTTYYNLIVK